jgi:hypothetical protein
LYVARESFVARVGDTDITFVGNRTTVREGHPILDTHGHLFDLKRADLEVDVEQATANPGELRNR